MTPEVVPVSPGGAEVVDLLAAATATPSSPPGRRHLVGVSGAPGSGKSTLVELLASRERAATRTVVVPMDGFHLADVELARRGLSHRKGAPDTFDAWGYAAFLARLADRPDHTVMAPAFTRDLDQPLAGAIPVDPAVDVVLTEGNYLLLDDPAWRAARATLDAVWHVRVPDDVRRDWLVRRHVAHGRTEQQARSWVEEVDEPNARLVALAAARADVVLDLTGWDWRLGDDDRPPILLG